MRKVLPLFAALIFALPFIIGCREEKKVDVAKGLDPKKMPTMLTHNVATYITDSGITQYKIVTPVWYVYDETDTPYWSFPEGLYLQKYDRAFKTIASVACDSAKYFRKKKLWKLDGNVEMHKEPKNLFLTQQLFWDEQRHKIYSDSFIHVETPTQVLEGHGFISDENLRVYRVIRPTGIFPVPQQ